VADGVRQLSTLRALQVFRQSLMKCDVGHKDRARIDDRLTKKTRTLNRTEAYRRIELSSRRRRFPGSPPLLIWGAPDLMR